MLEASDLRVGATYRAKHPAGQPPHYNDRTITGLVIRDEAIVEVQYDSPVVVFNRTYPTVTVEKFLGWAEREVTE